MKGFNGRDWEVLLKKFKVKKVFLKNLNFRENLTKEGLRKGLPEESLRYRVSKDLQFFSGRQSAS